MKSIREYKHHMKTIVYSNWFSYAFLFATLLIWHARLYCSGDDLYFANVWKDESLGVLVFCRCVINNGVHECSLSLFSYT